MAIIKNKRQSIGDGVKKLEFLCTVGENVDWSSNMKSNMAVPPKSNPRTTLWCSNATSGLVPRRKKVDKYVEGVVCRRDTP